MGITLQEKSKLQVEIKELKDQLLKIAETEYCPPVTTTRTLKTQSKKFKQSSYESNNKWP